MGGRVTLKETQPKSLPLFLPFQSLFWRCLSVVTHRIFIWVHRERQLLERLSDLSDGGPPGHSQKLVVVLALPQNCMGQCEKEGQRQQQLALTGPPTPAGNLAAHHQPFSMTTHLGDAIRKHVETSFSVTVTSNAFVHSFISPAPQLHFQFHTSRYVAPQMVNSGYQAQ